MDEQKYKFGFEVPLSAILRSIAFKEICRNVDENTSFNGVFSDSRKCDSNSIFVAIKGTVGDGHQYLDQVIEQGCSVVVVQDGFVPKEKYKTIVHIIEVKDSRDTYAKMAANFYGNPAEELELVGITGTNGKTTITYLLEEVLIGMGHPVGVIGTVDYRWFGKDCKKYTQDAARTTPDAIELQSMLRKMADVGVEYVLMEVSSHALDQKRIGDIKFSTAAFTNLSHDHLDYHLNFEDYFHAKSLLFSSHLAEEGSAIVAIPEKGTGKKWAAKMAQFCQKRKLNTLVCGPVSDATVKLTNQEFNLEGCKLGINYAGESYDLASPLVGRFNVENLLVTFGLAIGLGFSVEEVLPRLSVASGAPGRLQRVGLTREWNGNCPEIFVDYAHTPDALQKVLETLREIPHKDLICVFGCGGDRDNSKRPVMGEIGSSLSTIAIVTSDNPRTESPEIIIEQVVEGVIDGGCEIKRKGWLLNRKNGEKGVLVIEDRSDAIKTAISSASAGDIVLIAGKGHEKYQLTQDGERFFDDCLEAQEAMVAWSGEHFERALSSMITGNIQKWWSGRIETDSRKVTEGDVFVALVGENFDGHDYVKDVEEKGASLVIISDPNKLTNHEVIPFIVVDDTLKALGDLAEYRRGLVQDIKMPEIVGITGSCGKTTVKEMVASIYKYAFPLGKKVPAERVLKTSGNFNNLIGLPLSLLPIGLNHEVAILEMGMNRYGEIERLAQIADPSISCITNIHAAHLEELGSIEGVAKAKRELFDNTKSEGTLIINLDDSLCSECLTSYKQKKITFSVSDDKKRADLVGMNVVNLEGGQVSFALYIGEEIRCLKLSVAGDHNVSNALAAAAICFASGVSVDVISQGLESFRPTDKRMEVSSLPNGVNIINDSYNANPASMLAGLKALVQAGKGKSVAVLGDMLELGETTEKAHYGIGDQLKALGVDYVALFGENSKHILKGALESGFLESSIKHFEEKTEISSWIQKLIKNKDLMKDDWILFKGSRGMKMETIIQQLEEGK